MPTYTYECQDCGEQVDRVLAITAAPDEMDCGACSGTATKIINWSGSCLIVGKEKPHQLTSTSVPIGWEKGNTGKKQAERYSKLVQHEKKMARQNRQVASKVGWRKIASVPREFARMRSNQFGKDYLDPTIQSSDELKTKLASDDLLLDGK